MRDDRDVAIVVLLLLAVTCVTILILKLAEPTGGLVELLFPRFRAEHRRSGRIGGERKWRTGRTDDPSAAVEGSAATVPARPSAARWTTRFECL